MPNAQSAHPLRTSREDHLFARPLRECPACGSDLLEPVVEAQGGDVHFFCRACDRCWRIELGYIHRVNPPAFR